MSSLEQKVAFDGQTLVRQIATMYSSTHTDSPTLEDVTRTMRASHAVDPFGESYRLDVEGTDPWSADMVIDLRRPR